MTTRFENAYGIYFSVPHAFEDYEKEDWDEVEKMSPMWGFSVRWNTDAGYSITNPQHKSFAFEDHV